jgi:nucleoside-diphosphate-sugar epimerase
VRIFVTGGTGFVGSHLVEALLDRGHDVVCLVRDPAKLSRRFQQNSPRSVDGNLDDTDALRAGCDGADVVFHSAALTAARNRAEFFAVNVAATRRLTEAAAAVAPDLQRFVYISSQSAGGPSQRGVPKVEADPSTPISNYGQSKLAGEDVVKESGLPWTIMRPPSVYGPYDTAFLTVFKYARLGVLPTFGDGKQELSMVYVTDLVNALLHATEPATSSRSYFTCHPEITTTTELGHAIHRSVRQAGVKARGPFVLRLPTWATKVAMQVTGTGARLLGKATLLSPDKAKELLADAWTCDSRALERDTGWRAETSLEEGALRTAIWYKEHGWL